MAESRTPVAMPGHAVSSEVLLRIFLTLTSFVLEFVEPFERKIQPEEAWLYKNPRTDSYVPVRVLIALVLIVPSSVILFVNYIEGKNRSDIAAGHLAYTLSLGLSGVTTNLMKICVGRPRPDFFFRCFPNGLGNFEMSCTGDKDVILEGRKSFPSGHASLAFASFTVTSFYLLAKLRALNSVSGRIRTHRTLLGIIPIVVALLIAISRTCDYHHHWQDVSVGALIGLVAGTFSYHQQYPTVWHPEAPVPLVEFPKYSDAHNNNLPFEKQNVKWI